MALYEPFLGTVAPVAFPWAMPGWSMADGSRIPIAQNTALYYALQSWPKRG